MPRAYVSYACSFCCCVEGNEICVENITLLGSRVIRESSDNDIGEIQNGEILGLFKKSFKAKYVYGNYEPKKK